MPDLPAGAKSAAGERGLREGDAVRVRSCEVPGHVRTPAYVQRAVGTVDRTLGEHPNPELLAYQMTAPSAHLLRVRFRSCDLFPDRLPDSTKTTQDAVTVDIYAHWLERLG